MKLFGGLNGVLVSYPAGFSQSRGRNEAALADLLLLGCFLDFRLFLVGIVRRDRFPYHDGQFAPSKSRLLLHRHDGSTLIQPSEVTAMELAGSGITRERYPRSVQLLSFTEGPKFMQRLIAKQKSRSKDSRRRPGARPHI